MITGDEIAGMTFSVESEGYDQGEVKQHLEYLADQIDDLSYICSVLRRKLRARGVRPISDNESEPNDSIELVKFTTVEDGYSKTEVDQFVTDITKKIKQLETTHQTLKQMLQEETDLENQTRVNEYIPQKKPTSGIKCPECGASVSTTDEICGNCGYPLKNKPAQKMDQVAKTTSISSQKPRNKAFPIIFAVIAILVVIVLVNNGTLNNLFGNSSSSNSRSVRPVVTAQPTATPTYEPGASEHWKVGSYYVDRYYNDKYMSVITSKNKITGTNGYSVMVYLSETDLWFEFYENGRQVKNYSSSGHVWACTVSSTNVYGKDAPAIMYPKEYRVFFKGQYDSYSTAMTNVVDVLSQGGTITFSFEDWEEKMNRFTVSFDADELVKNYRDLFGGSITTLSFSK